MNTNYKYSVSGLAAQKDEEGRELIDEGYFTVLREAISAAKRAMKAYPASEMHVFQMEGSMHEGYVIHTEWDTLFSRYAN